MDITAQQEPLVSVIIPYYNQPLFLAETVESVRRQTYRNIEIIVIDDGSPVPAASVLCPSDDVLIVRTPNQERSAARNSGCDHSSGNFLIFLDADDLLMPNAVEVHIKLFAAEPQAALSFGAVTIIDEVGRELVGPHVCRPRDDYFSMFLQGNPIACPGAAMIRRSAFLEVNRFDSKLRMAEDYLLYLQLSSRYPTLRTATCVAAYRHHANSTSRDKEPMLVATLTVLDSIEANMKLTSAQTRSLRHGRKRWTHEFRRKNTIAYRLKSVYYSLRAMLSVPLKYYLHDRVAS